MHRKSLTDALAAVVVEIDQTLATDQRDTPQHVIDQLADTRAYACRASSALAALDAARRTGTSPFPALLALAARWDDERIVDDAVRRAESILAEHGHPAEPWQVEIMRRTIGDALAQTLPTVTLARGR